MNVEKVIKNELSLNDNLSPLTREDVREMVEDQNNKLIIESIKGELSVAQSNVDNLSERLVSSELIILNNNNICIANDINKSSKIIIPQIKEIEYKIEKTFEDEIKIFGLGNSLNNTFDAIYKYKDIHQEIDIFKNKSGDKIKFIKDDKIKYFQTKKKINKTKSISKSCYEYCMEVDDEEKFLKLLELMGYKKKFSGKKTRRTWIVNEFTNIMYDTWTSGFGEDVISYYEYEYTLKDKHVSSCDLHCVFENNIKLEPIYYNKGTLSLNKLYDEYTISSMNHLSFGQYINYSNSVAYKLNKLIGKILKKIFRVKKK